MKSSLGITLPFFSSTTRVVLALSVCNLACVHRGGLKATGDRATVYSTGELERGSAVLVVGKRVEHVGTPKSAAHKAGRGSAVVDIENASFAPAFAPPRVMLPTLSAESGEDPEQHLAPLRQWVSDLVSWGLTEVQTTPLTLLQLQALQTWDALGQLPLRMHAVVEGQGPEAHLIVDRGPFRGRMLNQVDVRFVLDAAALASDELKEQLLLYMNRGFRVVLGVKDAALVAQAQNWVQRAAVPAEAWALELEGNGAAVQTDAVENEKVAWVLTPSELAFASAKVNSWLLQSRPLKLSLPPGAAGSPMLEALATLVTGCASDEACQGVARRALFNVESHGRLIAPVRADFVALSVDPSTASPKALQAGRALLTVVDGVAVFRRKRVEPTR